MFSRRGLFAALCLLLLPFQDCAQAGDAADAVIVTVTGNIGQTNRGASDPFQDAFFNYHGLSFDKADAFSRDDLEALGMNELSVKYPQLAGRSRKLSRAIAQRYSGQGGCTGFYRARAGARRLCG